ncbi:hypothetical protein ACUXV3_02070 [Roseobacteraceae bacterium NS-SX3]
MIGVVLWSDAALQKAVIWCEDQGDLAFYKQGDAARTQRLHTGDWVEFDVKLAGSLRLAEHPVVLDEPGCPDVAARLASMASGAAGGAANGASRGNVVPFTARRPDQRRGFASRRSGSA